jgi:hypothetical protein
MEVFMEQKVNSIPAASTAISVPEKHFLKWLNEQSRIARLKLKYDLAKESLPYITALLMLIFTGLVYREALIGVAPTLFAWIIHALKKRSEKKDKDAD